MKNVPKIRFRGFDEEWESFKIKDVFTIKSGGTPSRDNTEYWNGDIPWITTSEVDFNIINTSNEKITAKAVSETAAKVFPPNTILVAMYGQGITRGKSAILNINAATNQACAALLPNEWMDSRFTYQYLSKSYNRLREMCNSGGQKNLSLSIIGDFKIALPQLKEQEKISTFLTKVDKLIEKQDEKVKNYELYKKGMMQKIFSQEIRFRGDKGEEYPEWEERKISDIFEVTRGEVIAKKDISAEITEKNKYPVYSSQTLNNGVLGYDVTYDFNGEYLTWTTDGANAGYVFSRKGKFRCTNVCGLLVEKKDTIGYANNCVKEVLQKETPKHVSYVGNPKLMNKEMAGIEIKLPCLKEQIKIANFLSKIDDLIEKEKEKLENIKNWKKGLLQGMFV